MNGSAVFLKSCNKSMPNLMIGNNFFFFLGNKKRSWQALKPYRERFLLSGDPEKQPQPKSALLPFPVLSASWAATSQFQLDVVHFFPELVVSHQKCQGKKQHKGCSQHKDEHLFHFFFLFAAINGSPAQYTQFSVARQQLFPCIRYFKIK